MSNEVVIYGDKDWDNGSELGSFRPYTWKELVELAKKVVTDYQKGSLYNTDANLIRYYAAMGIVRTVPLDVETCAAYNLLANTLHRGDLLIFGDLCLYYGVSEAVMVERLRTDKELSFVLMFYDTLCNKLNIVEKMVDSKALKQYEASRGGGIFLPYQERASIAESASRFKVLESIGEDIVKRMLSSDDYEDVAEDD